MLHTYDSRTQRGRRIAAKLIYIESSRPGLHRETLPQNKQTQDIICMVSVIADVHSIAEGNYITFSLFLLKFLFSFFFFSFLHDLSIYRILPGTMYLMRALILWQSFCLHVGIYSHETTCLACTFDNSIFFITLFPWLLISLHLQRNCLLTPGNK